MQPQYNYVAQLSFLFPVLMIGALLLFFYLFVMPIIRPLIHRFGYEVICLAIDVRAIFLPEYRLERTEFLKLPYQQAIKVLLDKNVEAQFKESVGKLHRKEP